MPLHVCDSKLTDINCIVVFSIGRLLFPWFSRLINNLTFVKSLLLKPLYCQFAMTSVYILGSYENPRNKNPAFYEKSVVLDHVT